MRALQPRGWKRLVRRALRLRNNTEHCIFATRGRPMVPEVKPLATWFVWPRGAHSAKPDAFYDLVEKVSPGPYLEMFTDLNLLEAT